MNIIEEKKKLRNHYKSVRNNISLSDRAEKNNIILNNILSLAEYSQSDIIFSYVSFGTETDTYNFIKQALNCKKRVAVPYCIPNTPFMEFYFINDINSLIKGSFGVMEPNINNETKATDLSSGICLVPGLSFTYNGYRLGYGKGFYDRFLDKFGGISVGLCYECQITQSLPIDEYDKSINIIVSEEKIRRL